jgi:hypothetical protein
VRKIDALADHDWRQPRYPDRIGAKLGRKLLDLDACLARIGNLGSLRTDRTIAKSCELRPLSPLRHLFRRPELVKRDRLMAGFLQQAQEQRITVALGAYLRNSLHSTTRFVHAC